MEKIGKYCQKCKVELKRYDEVERMVRRKGNRVEHIFVERYYCPVCRSVHRYLPDTLYPYKQYEAEIVDGVKEGLIDSTTLGYEDYPSEMTMKRWQKENEKDN